MKTIYVLKLFKYFYVLKQFNSKGKTGKEQMMQRFFQHAQPRLYEHKKAHMDK